ncbi:phage portal protein [Cereibacter sphaeroides]|uniref:phage portal protein n=1 Tax=Cereibacter sphaeroides TaxID=1063 RepID=UPI000066400A|nr:phage portal protein, HK97 family [Cereibacter sphaeroides ATCC 17029]
MGMWHKLVNKMLTARDGDLYEAVGAAETWAGEPVSAQGAMNLSAFFACARVTAETVASLSLEVMERKEDGTKVRVAHGHPLQELLGGSPNADQTPMEFWEGRILGLCTTGNAFAEKVYQGNRVVALLPMPATTAVERRGDDLLYRFNDRGRAVVLPADKVFHVKAFGDGDVGLSPVEYARQTLGIAIASERAAGQVYSRGLRAKGFFLIPGALTPEQREAARKNLADRYSAKDAPGVGILEGGVKFEGVNITPRDAELILNRRFNVEEVCRWMGCPPILVGHAAQGQTMWGTGVEAVMQQWLNLSLRALLKRIEQASAKRVLSVSERGRFSAKFNYEDLLRSNSAARAAYYTSLLNCGVLTINEARRLEGLPPVEGGDVPRMQMQNVPITEAGAEPPGEQP